MCSVSRSTGEPAAFIRRISLASRSIICRSDEASSSSHDSIAAKVIASPGGRERACSGPSDKRDRRRIGSGGGI